MNEPLQILPLILEASLVVKGVMAVLVLLSLIGWLLIFRLSAKLSGGQRDDKDFEEWFWSGDGLTNIYNALSGSGERTGLAQVFYVGYGEYLRLNKASKLKDSVDETFNAKDVRNEILDATERKFRVSLGRQQAYLEGGLPTLASIASVSPYIGLFGTVWGIMTAFIGLGQADSVSLATVAPGIAEALIATAMGLFAAIPASLAFNHFTAKAGAVYDSRALFCDELTGVIGSSHLVNAQ